MIIDKSIIPKKSESILFRGLDDGSILYDVEIERAHILNIYASYVWEHCDNQRSVQEIINAIEEELNETGKDHAKEIIFTLEQFAKEGLVVL